MDQTQLKSFRERRAAFIKCATIHLATLVRQERNRRREQDAKTKLVHWDARRALAQAHGNADMTEIADEFAETFKEWSDLWAQLAQEDEECLQESEAALCAIRSPYEADLARFQDSPEFAQLALPDPGAMPRDEAERERTRRDVELEAESPEFAASKAQLEREFTDWEASIGVN